MKEHVLRAGGALRALARRLLGSSRELSLEEVDALVRLVQARQRQERAEAMLRDVHLLRRALDGEIPVPEGMHVEIAGRVYPPGSWVRRTLRLIQGGAP